MGSARAAPHWATARSPLLPLPPPPQIKSIVFGGLDGIITTFSTIASVAGGGLGLNTVIVLGFANLIADGIAMGVGDGLSSKAEQDFLNSEKKREEWEYQNHPDGERREMVEILKGKGFTDEDAVELISIVSQPKHREFFIDYMMVEELGEQAPDDPWGPLKEGSITFISFLIFGTVPMWVYIACYAAGYKDADATFGIAAAATVVTLFALGATQGSITRQSIIKSGTLMTINGSFASAAAYLVR